jgi:hypothetical protein
MSWVKRDCLTMLSRVSSGKLNLGAWGGRESEEQINNNQQLQTERITRTWQPLHSESHFLAVACSCLTSYLLLLPDYQLIMVQAFPCRDDSRTATIVFYIVQINYLNRILYFLISAITQDVWKDPEGATYALTSGLTRL